MCNAHYLRWRKHGDTQPDIPIRGRSRGVEFCSTGCGKVVLARGWCATHYQRWRTTGSPGGAELLRISGDPDATEKRCTVCGEVRPIEDFYKTSRVRDGRFSYCRFCAIRQNKSQSLRRKYGLTITDRDALVAAQKGACPICKETPAKLVIDHCHRSGKVRALLCDRCNRLLGVAGDDVALLQASIRFLKKHQT